MMKITHKYRQLWNRKMTLELKNAVQNVLAGHLSLVPITKSVFGETFSNKKTVLRSRYTKNNQVQTNHEWY